MQINHSITIHFANNLFINTYKVGIYDVYAQTDFHVIAIYASSTSLRQIFVLEFGFVLRRTICRFHVLCKYRMREWERIQFVPHSRACSKGDSGASGEIE